MSVISESAEVIDWAQSIADLHSWMLNIVRSRVDGRNTAEEIVQDVSLLVLQHQHRPVDREKIRPWLFQILTRRVADHYRRLGVERRATGSLHNECETFSSMLVDSVESWHWLAASEERATLASCMSELDEQDQAILVMKYRDRASYKDIASQLACSERSVEHRLVRAKQRLKQLLTDEWPQAGNSDDE